MDFVGLIERVAELLLLVLDVVSESTVDLRLKVADKTSEGVDAKRACVGVSSSTGPSCSS